MNKEKKIEPSHFPFSESANCRYNERRLKTIKRTLIVIFIIIILPALIYAAVEDYLILGDIVPYKLSRPEAFFPGEPPMGGPRVYDRSGVIAATGHFPDHTDKTYEVMYIGGNGMPSPTVQVTQHAGSDSDKWLLHEVDLEFRNYYGIPGGSYAVVPINGNTVLEFGSAGWDYRWISGNKLIKIEYHDPQMTKPEPLEIVKAYLAKHPSTFPTMTLIQLRSTENKTKWIKDEMERRLWLCDKWFMQLQLGKADQKTVLENTVNSMKVFLDYREKYFGIAAANEKNLIAGYLNTNNGTAIKAKLTEYKVWWNENKNSAISL